MAKSDFLGDASIFLDRRKKIKGFFGVAKKGLRDYFLYCPNYAAQRQTLLTSAACIAPQLVVSLIRQAELFIFG